MLDHGTVTIVFGRPAAGTAPRVTARANLARSAHVR
jgi:hypothetical protein